MTGQIEWLVEPLDANTNNIITQQLYQAVNDSQVVAVADVNGIKHNVWQVPNFAFISQLSRSKSTLDLHFVIYKRRILAGSFRSPLELVPFKPRRVIRIKRRRPS